jgi:Cytochrome P450
MGLYPEAQGKAQEELDKVIGPGRLPTFSDREHLPYIEALIKEIYRWNPVAPMGDCYVFQYDRMVLIRVALPHKLVQDDIYEGYYLPSGSIFFANTW